MKTAVFAAVAVMLLAGSMPGFAAPATTPTTAAAPRPDHEITYAQVRAAADKLWDRMDVNHDGKVDAADRDARLLEHFAKVDTNHDGVISKEEFLAYVHAGEGKWLGHRQGGPDGAPQGQEGRDHAGGPGGHPGGFVIRAIVAPAFHEARTNGVVTRTAFDAAVKARFDKLDVNHDGTLTGEELRAAWRGGWDRRADHRDDHHHEWGRHADGDTATPPPATGH